MAEVVISPLLQVLFEKLATSIVAELEPGRDRGRHLDKLTRILPVIQAVLEDAEQKQRKDKRIAAWLIELKHLADDIDDLLDELTTKHLWRKLKPKVHVPCLSLTPLSDRYRFPRKMKSIVERLDDTVAKMSGFHFKETVLLDRSHTLERRQTGPYVDESEVVGRTQDVDGLVELVLSSDRVNLCTLSVVGMGGVGKTTVAQLVYNDARVVRSFDLRIWISIGHEFRVKKIMSEILDCAVRDKCESQQLGVLQTKLHELLNAKRYILVLDDVWSDDQDEWEKLQCGLRSGAPGSKIIVTTRSMRVATTLSVIPPYTLNALSDDACSSLFMKRAFPSNAEQHEYPRLVEIGKGIVRKCRGVPLAAKILGNSLRLRREETEWSHVLESELWSLDEVGNRIMSALMLSFDYLPSEMKQCFAFCALFPKNFEITREKLIQVWIAEGLIRASSDTYSLKKMEDTGNDYFNELLSLSFFHSVNKGEENVKDCYGMHDLLHGLSKRVAGNEFFATGEHEFVQFDHNLSQVRHASVLCNFKDSSSIPDALWAASRLRTLRLYSPGDNVNRTLKTVLRKFKVLRVLDLSDSGIKRLSKCIGRLIHLRYLELARTFLETLPRAICRLCNLQTLNLAGCYSLKMLPEGIKRLTNLRHLTIEGCSGLTRMPSSIRSLLNLQTLSFYIVGRSFDESLFQLMHLDLRGELKIRCLENADDVVPQLCLEPKQLNSLSLCWGEDDEMKMNGYSRRTEDDHHGCDNEALLNCLQPNACLRKLHLGGYSGINPPKWLNCTKTPNLRELVMKNCRRCEHLPPLGQLRFLEILSIQGFNALKVIGGEFYGEERNGKKFVSLKQLTLTNLPSLEAWEGSISPADTFTCLESVSIIQCPNLQTMPWFPHVQHLELRNCNARIARSAAEATSLTTLIIHDFPELSFLPPGLLQNNSSLETLTISSCHRLTSLPWDLTNLKSLKSLTIRWCEELSALPKAIRNLTSLESMEITECPSLCSLPEEGIRGLHSLRSLSIENCCNLTSLPRNTMHLGALEHLTIMYCPSLISLPDELQHLSSLHSLNIINCQELARLPDSLRRVKTLQHLEISNCPNVMELPEWIDQLVSLKIYDCHSIKSLPTGVQCLNDLQHISIRECPDLEEKCEEGKGQDWPKISHVPYTNIGSSSRLKGISSSSNAYKEHN